jgi:hypothetical protein
MPHERLALALRAQQQPEPERVEQRPPQRMREKSALPTRRGEDGQPDGVDE